MNDPKRILVVFLALLFIGSMCFGIKGKMDSSGYKKQVSYTTAIQATDADHFNYIVDSQQGRVLSTGTFTIDPKNAVKFDEMNKSYGYVKRTKEHYTQHERQVCETHYRTETHTRTVSDSKGRSHTETYTEEVPYDVCHEETYYSWDYVNEEEKQSSTITYFGRSYPTSLFSVAQFRNSADCKDFMVSGSGGGFLENKKGCLDGDNYLDDNNRYSYDVMPLSFSGTFLATTYGGLHPYSEKTISIEQKNIPQILKDVGHYQIVSFWVMTTILIIILIVACIVAYQWVMADGYWSTEE